MSIKFIPRSKNDIAPSFSLPKQYGMPTMTEDVTKSQSFVSKKQPESNTTEKNNFSSKSFSSFLSKKRSGFGVDGNGNGNVSQPQPQSQPQSFS